MDKDDKKILMKDLPPQHKYADEPESETAPGQGSGGGSDDGSLGTRLMTFLKGNARDYVMYLALIVIFAFFTITTNGNFLTARNLTNLINQTGYVAILAIGMTCILIIKHIDLSVGFVAGFTGAIAAILMARYQFSEWVVIPIVLLVGLAIGFYHGVMVAYVGVPAFVITLAGMFIFRGMLTLTLQSTGTIIVPERNAGFIALSNGFIPNIGDGDLNITALLIAAVLIILMVVSAARQRQSKLKYHFKVSSTPTFIAQLLVFAIVIGAVFWTLANERGVPWTLLIVGVVLAIYNFILNKTKTGRYIYGVGGNQEAAELSGVNVKKITLLVFMSMSMMAALAGVLYTSRMRSATPTAGLGFEMDAIASSYIGGVAVSGGVGRVTNTIVGALVIMSLTNGMNLMQIDVSYQYIVRGLIFTLAVAFDIRSRRK